VKSMVRADGKKGQRQNTDSKKAPNRRRKYAISRKEEEKGKFGNANLPYVHTIFLSLSLFYCFTCLSCPS